MLNYHEVDDKVRQYQLTMTAALVRYERDQDNPENIVKLDGLSSEVAAYLGQVLQDISDSEAHSGLTISDTSKLGTLRYLIRLANTYLQVSNSFFRSDMHAMAIPGLHSPIAVMPAISWAATR